MAAGARNRQWLARVLVSFHSEDSASRLSGGSFARSGFECAVEDDVQYGRRLLGRVGRAAREQIRQDRAVEQIADHLKEPLLRHRPQPAGCFESAEQREMLTLVL